MHRTPDPSPSIYAPPAGPPVAVPALRFSDVSGELAGDSHRHLPTKPVNAPSPGSKARRMLLALLAVAVSTGLTAPAYAEAPASSGSPDVVTVSLVDEADPPAFLCNGREVRFSSGEATVRDKQQHDGQHTTVQLHDADATDGQTTYQAHGGWIVHWREDPEFVRFAINVTLVGAHGAVERVRSTITLRHGQWTFTEPGTCTAILNDE